MAKFAIVSTDRPAAGPVALGHLGQTIDTLRAALVNRMKYDPLETIRDDRHETRLRAMGALFIHTDDTTGRILVVG